MPTESTYGTADFSSIEDYGVAIILIYKLLYSRANMLEHWIRRFVQQHLPPMKTFAVIKSRYSALLAVPKSQANGKQFSCLEYTVVSQDL